MCVYFLYVLLASLTAHWSLLSKQPLTTYCKKFLPYKAIICVCVHPTSATGCLRIFEGLFQTSIWLLVWNHVLTPPRPYRVWNNCASGSKSCQKISPWKRQSILKSNAYLMEWIEGRIKNLGMLVVGMIEWAVNVRQKMRIVKTLSLRKILRIVNTVWMAKLNWA